MSEGWKPGTGQKIERVFAWVAIEPDGGEGIIGAEFNGQWFPLIGADTARIESYRPIALQVATMAKLPCKLVEYATRREIEHHEP